MKKSTTDKNKSHEILGVKANAKPEIINSAYEKRREQLDNDLSKAKDLEKKEEVRKKIRELNGVYNGITGSMLSNLKISPASSSKGVPALENVQKSVNIVSSPSTATSSSKVVKPIEKTTDKNKSHEILGVEANAKREEINNAFKKLELQWNKGKHSKDDEKEAKANFSEIKKAYENLTNPQNVIASSSTAKSQEQSNKQEQNVQA